MDWCKHQDFIAICVKLCNMKMVSFPHTHTYVHTHNLTCMHVSLTHQIEHCIFSPKWPLLPSILLAVFRLDFSHTPDHHRGVWTGQNQQFSSCSDPQQECFYKPNLGVQYLWHLNIPSRSKFYN